LVQLLVGSQVEDNLLHKLPLSIWNSVRLYGHRETLVNKVLAECARSHHLAQNIDDLGQELHLVQIALRKQLEDSGDEFFIKVLLRENAPMLGNG
jgi:hypothetical protein